MSRLWMGGSILLVLLLLCFWVTATMEEIHRPISDTLRNAGEAAMDGNWEQAESLATQARSLWFQNRSFTASVADHAPMDEIDSLFAQLPLSVRQEDALLFASLCSRLSVLTEAMSEGHCPVWWNFL